MKTTGAPADVRGSWVAWMTVAILVAFYILSFADRMLFSLVADDIKHDLNLSELQLSLLLGFAFSLFYSIVGLPLGWLADRYSRRIMLFFGVLFWSAASACCGLAGSYGPLFAARAGVGIGEATLYPCGYSLLGSLFDRKRLTFAAGVFGVGASIGVIVALVGGGYLVESLKTGALSIPGLKGWAPWRIAFLLTAFPGVLLAGLAFVIHEPARDLTSAEHKAGSSWTAMGRFIASERWLILRHMLSIPTLAMTVYASNAWTPVFLMRRFGVQVHESGLIVAFASGFATMAGGLVISRIIDALVERGVLDAAYRVIMWTSLIGLPFGVASYVFAPSAVWSGGLLAIYFFLATSYLGAATSSLTLIAPEPLKGKMFSLFWLVMGIMGAIGPFAAAWFAQQVSKDPKDIGVGVAILICVAVPFAALMFALNLKRLREIAAGHVAREADEAAIPLQAPAE
jgi:MFS family permease